VTQDLVSTAPGVYTALLGLVQTAAAAQTPAVASFAFELGSYEPGSYVNVHAIENQNWDWAYLGTFTQYEEFDITGCATVYSGDSPFTNPSVATTVLNQTYTLMQACVMTPLMSNRTIPILGGPSNVIEMTPNFSRYQAGPGEMVGGVSGWYGLIDWSFHFRANVTPQ
jgi:hypothetical protein